MKFNVGGFTVNASTVKLNDYIDIGNKSLKRLRVQIADA